MASLALRNLVRGVANRGARQISTTNTVNSKHDDIMEKWPAESEFFIVFAVFRTIFEFFFIFEYSFALLFLFHSTSSVFHC